MEVLVTYINKALQDTGEGKKNIKEIGLVDDGHKSDKWS